jgi:hypothetical protein
VASRSVEANTGSSWLAGGEVEGFREADREAAAADVEEEELEPKLINLNLGDIENLGERGGAPEDDNIASGGRPDPPRGASRREAR